MLRFESELSCIPVSEPDVLALHRSTQSVSLDSDPASDPSLDASVCLAREEAGRRVYVAFHQKRIRRTLVYSATDATGDDAFLPSAFALPEALGFSLEEVGLKFGRAMREVILRQMPVLCDAESAERIRREHETELARLQSLISGQDAGEDEDAEAKEGDEKERQAREAAIAAARRKLALEERHAEQVDSLRRCIDERLAALNAPEAIAAAEEECERLRSAQTLLQARCRELENAAAESASAARKAEEKAAEAQRTLDEERQSRDAEGQGAAKREEEAAGRIAELEAELAGARDAADDLKKEIDSALERGTELEQALREAEGTKQMESAGLSAGLRDQVAGLESELAQNRGELESLREEKESLKTALIVAEERRAELEGELSELASVPEERPQSGSERAEREAELEEALRRTSEEAAEERTALTDRAEKAERQLEELQQTIAPSTEEPAHSDASRLAELEEELLRLKETLEAERFERELLVREKCLAEKRLAELAAGESVEGLQPDQQESAAALAEAEKRIGYLTEALGLAEKKAATLSRELELSKASRAPVESPGEGPAETGGGQKRLAPLRLGPASQGRDAVSDPVEDEAASPPPHVLRRPPRRGAFFHVDWDLSRIEYGHPDEILDVYQSTGMIQLSLEGYPNQFCSACIVVRRQDKQRQVHIAFALAESRRNLIYSPAKPLRSEADYDRALGEAFKFLQVVGYSPEKLHLGSGAEDRGRSLAEVEVLSGTIGKAQGF